MNSNWKGECNYWRKQNKSGERINIIRVDGVEVEVSDEVYAVYADMGQKERYARIKANKRQLSLEQMQEDALPVSMLSRDIYTPSAEDDYVASISDEELHRRKRLLARALAQLKPDERALIQCLFQDGVSPYMLARLRGVSFQSVYKRRKRILEKIKKIITNLEKQG